jgi:hypothetical protein
VPEEEEVVGSQRRIKLVSWLDLWPNTERDPAGISRFSAEAHTLPDLWSDPAKKKRKSDTQGLITSTEDLPVAHHRNL